MKFADPNALLTLQRVMTLVQENNSYVTDQQNYGVPEYWEYAKGKGDCEDYALAMMKMLRDRGWPIASLDIGICMLQGGGHAVLVAHTEHGDYILDNNLTEPKMWNELPQYSVDRNVHWRKIWPERLGQNRHDGRSMKTTHLQ